MGVETEQRKVLRAVIYVRISNDKRRGSLDEGLGVKEQEKQCRELAAQLGAEVVKVYTDNDVSAYSRKPRPEYQELLGFLRQAKADIVLVWHNDRLHRNNSELEDYINVVEPRDIKTHTVKTGLIDLNTPSGRMVARQLCAIARYESEHRAERISLARLRQARQGKYGGGFRRPYGFEKDGVTPIREEVAIIQKMADAVRAGVSLREIARDLRDRNIPTAMGTQWMPTTVKTVLLRPRNAGFMVHRENGSGSQQRYTEDDVVGMAPWDPIIELDEWRTVVSKLTDPARRTSEAGRAPKYLGSGIYECPCGAGLRVKIVHKRTTYQCPERGSGHATVAVADADDFVRRVVIARLSQKDAAVHFETPESDIDVPALRSELVNYREELQQYAADRAARLITREQMLLMTEQTTEKINQIEQQLSEAEKSSPVAKIIGSKDPAKAWDALMLGERRVIIREFFSIKLRRVGSGRRNVKIQDRIAIQPLKESDS